MAINLLEESVKAAVSQVMAETEAEHKKSNEEDWPISVRELLDNMQIKKLFDQMRNTKKSPLIDVCSEEDHEFPYQLADILLSLQSMSISKLHQVFADCRGTNRKEMNRFPLTFYTGLKLAESKLLLSQVVNRAGNAKPIEVTVIFPMYNEVNRIKKQSEHEYGENFLRLKVKQLQWLFEGYENDISYELLGVDDGCPSKPSSTDVANAIIKEELTARAAQQDKEGWDCVRIIQLQEAIDANLAEFSDMKSTKDSRKGGAIHYAMYCARQKRLNDKQNHREHVCIFTDADTSSDLGQSGLFLGALLLPKYKKLLHNDGEEKQQYVAPKMAFGDRYENGAWDTGKELGFYPPNHTVGTIRHFFRGLLLPSLKNVLDSQCGYKAFNLSILDDAYFEGLKERSFGFDMELFCAMDSMNLLYVPVPIAWAESSNESAFWDYSESHLKPEYAKAHYVMITDDILAIHDKKYKDDKRCDPKWVEFVRNLKWDDYYHNASLVYQSIVNDESDKVFGQWSVSLQQWNEMLTIPLKT